MGRLWNNLSGEPFMVNPHLGILGAVNPKKKGSRSMAHRSQKAKMAWVRSFRKNPRRHHARRHRHHAKRNPFPMAGLVVNPRRARRNPGRFASRANAGIAGLFKLPPLQSVLYVGAGLIGTPIAEGFVGSWLPVSITGSTIGKYAVRIATVLGLSFLASKTLGREPAKMVAIGGGAYVLTTAIKEFAPGFIPGLAAYTGNMGAYTGNRLGAPAWGARNTTIDAGDGGMNVVAARFRRFQ